MSKGLKSEMGRTGAYLVPSEEDLPVYGVIGSFSLFSVGGGRLQQFPACQMAYL